MQRHNGTDARRWSNTFPLIRDHCRIPQPTDRRYAVCVYVCVPASLGVPVLVHVFVCYCAFLCVRTAELGRRCFFFIIGDVLW